MLQVSRLVKEFPAPGGALRILDGVDLQLDRGQAIAIMGPSGSGKSTLLHVLGVLDSPTSGEVTLDGQNPHGLKEADQARFRGEKIGFVFQDHSLLPQCSVLENVLAPTLVAGKNGDYPSRAKRLLDSVGMSGRIDHLPGQISGGEKQRAAIARALIRQPVLLLCDEPTGNLDRSTADKVAELLLNLHQEQQTILVVVTHSLELAERFPIRLELRERRLVPAS